MVTKVQYPSTQGSSITTQTRLGNDIPNFQAALITRLDESQSDNLRRKHPNASFRTAIIPHYNCHGLTFAARRTAIDDSSFIRHILSEDNYTQVREADIMPGDIILYLDPSSGDIEHSGIVIRLERLGSTLIPEILSKWGKAGEATHLISHCPYDSSRVEYYRMAK